MRQPNRIEPRLPASAFKTYALAAPRSTHRRPATCAEVECAAWAHGWVTTVDTATELGREQAAYLRGGAGRRHREERGPELGMIRFVFPAGQRCFAQHTVPLEREPLYLVRGGDHRGDPSGRRPYQHTRPELWVEDFAEHQAGIAEKIERG